MIDQSRRLAAACRRLRFGLMQMFGVFWIIEKTPWLTIKEPWNTLYKRSRKNTEL